MINVAKPVLLKNVSFPYDQLRRLLRYRETVCVVGYGLSCECLAPHYFDIQKGIWSELTHASKLNPFKSTKDYQLIMKWFNWRRGGIRTSAPSKPYQILRSMQQTFGLSIATQCVDGLVGSNQIESLELYGNALQTKCIDSGHEGRWPYQANDDSYETKCDLCGALLLPDVQMFSWNSKAEVQNNLRDLIRQAKLLIKIGTDADLEPFNIFNSNREKLPPTLEISAIGFVLHDGDNVFKVSITDIEAEIESRTGKPQRSGNKTLENAMQNFLHLYSDAP
jgi:NAD-dependent SIR2 family protein deacetylase